MSPWTRRRRCCASSRSRSVQRVGGTEPIRRRRPPRRRHEQGPLAGERRTATFREDLYYRLAVVPDASCPRFASVPHDVPLLANHFLQQLRQTGIGRDAPVKLTDKARPTGSRSRPWPGNVRQLRNLMERSAILVEGDQLRREGPRAPHRPRRVGGRRHGRLPHRARPSRSSRKQAEKLFLQQRLHRERLEREAHGRVGSACSARTSTRRSSATA